MQQPEWNGEDQSRRAEGEIPIQFKQALDQNVELKSALINSGLPSEFQAMVLGLATFRQVNPKRR